MIRVKPGMIDTIQADELRHVKVKSITDDYRYYAIMGRYKPGARWEMKAPSDEFYAEIHKLKLLADKMDENEKDTNEKEDANKKMVLKK